MLEEGERTRDKGEHVPWREPVAAAPRRLLPVVGCLVRLVLVALLLIVLALAALFLLLGGLIQGLMVELSAPEAVIAAAFAGVRIGAGAPAPSATSETLPNGQAAADNQNASGSHTFRNE